MTVQGARTLSFSWSFESGQQDAFCGQFANGDYWIAPAADENSVTVTAVIGTGSGALSLDENPKPESIGLLDSVQYLWQLCCCGKYPEYFAVELQRGYFSGSSHTKR